MGLNSDNSNIMKSNIMKILIITVKNAAVLDFVLPMCWNLTHTSHNPEFSVLHCSLNKTRILRNSRFYTREFNKLKIPQYDLLDLASPTNWLILLPLRLLFRNSHDYYATQEKRYAKYPLLHHILKKVKDCQYILETKYTNLIDYGKILSKLEPDLILLDNTSLKDLSESKYLYKALAKYQKRVILLPHAPHHSTTKAFTPFLPENPLPPFCEYWMPFKYDKTWVVLPAKKRQFFYTGYPGLDQKWLNYLKRNPTQSRSQQLKCLLIVRKFMPKGVKRQQDDHFAYEYQEFSSLIRMVVDLVYTTNNNIQIVVKPHPSNDRRALFTLFKELGVQNWIISNEPIYDQISVTDFVISLYSTILLVPAIVGIPTILIQSTRQEESHKDPHMRELYTKLSYYSKDLRSFRRNAKEVIQHCTTQSPVVARKIEADKKHIRNFFPNKAFELCGRRITSTNPKNPRQSG